MHARTYAHTSTHTYIHLYRVSWIHGSRSEYFLKTQTQIRGVHGRVWGVADRACPLKVTRGLKFQKLTAGLFICHYPPSFLVGRTREQTHFLFYN